MLTFIFRCLVSIDRFLSVALGRPCAIQEEEYAPLLFFYRRMVYKLYCITLASTSSCLQSVMMNTGLSITIL